MNREILFRGKRTDNGKWVFGYLTKMWGTWNIQDFDNENLAYMIDGDTLCQYTGLTDKNGNKIWENDIIRHDVSGTIGAVRWYKGDYVGWCVDDIIIAEQQFTDEMWDECEFIGNIFDNPELLEGGGNDA